MFLLNPKQPPRHCPDARSHELIQKTIGFFEAKGKGRLRKPSPRGRGSSPPS
jgi:hypothetical protein